MKKSFTQLLIPTLILFLSISLLFFACGGYFVKINLNPTVVLIGNLMLFLVSALITWMHVKAIKNPNPNVFSNSVMGGTMIKLMVFGVATVFYLFIAGNQRSVFAIFTLMVLYMLYTFFDVKTALLLNKKD